MCTKEELGLTEGRIGAKFMPIHHSSKQTLEIYRDNLYCVDANELEISGEYNSDNGKLIRVML